MCLAGAACALGQSPRLLPPRQWIKKIAVSRMFAHPTVCLLSNSGAVAKRVHNACMRTPLRRPPGPRKRKIPCSNFAFSFCVANRALRPDKLACRA